VELRVLDVQGRRVRTLVAAIVGPGTYRLLFDGRNDQGAELPSGTYFFDLRAGGLAATEKAALIR
jgi:hypothetical protein